jgi:hypothetical protein
VDPHAERMWPSRTKRSRAHRTRWWVVDEGLGLLVRTPLLGLSHARSTGLSPHWQARFRAREWLTVRRGRHEIRVLLFVVHYLVGRRSFERSRGLCFSALVTPLNRQWLRKSA